MTGSSAIDLKVPAEFFFYKLQERSLGQMLSVLLEKSHGMGWRVELRGRSDQRMRAIDGELWRSPKDSFLPHAMAGGRHDAMQPVLLCTEPVHRNSPDALVLVDGAAIVPEDPGRFQRISIIFEERNPDELAIARSQWKEMAATDLPLQFWAEDGGKWVKKAEANAGE